MTNQEKKKILQSYGGLVSELDALAKEREKWRDREEQLPGNTGDLHGIKEQIRKKMVQLEYERERIASAIDDVRDDRLRQLLYCRYIVGMKWDDIAAAMHYDPDAKKIFGLHSKALDAIKLDTERHPSQVVK